MEPWMLKLRRALGLPIPQTQYPYRAAMWRTAVAPFHPIGSVYEQELRQMTGGGPIRYGKPVAEGEWDIPDGGVLGEYTSRAYPDYGVEADQVTMNPRATFREGFSPEYVAAHEYGHRLASWYPWEPGNYNERGERVGPQPLQGVRDPARYAALPENVRAGAGQSYWDNDSEVLADDFARGVMNERAGLPISPTSFTPELLAVLRQGGVNTPVIPKVRPLNVRLDEALARMTGRR